MTLISAFRGKQSIALCADAQETVTYYDANGDPYDLRKAVQKISPVVVGGFHVAIAGSGNPTLIESFIVRAKRRLQHENLPNPHISDFVRIIEDELVVFYRNDIAVCPDTDKSIKLFIAASCPGVAECDAWVTEGIVLRELATDKPELVGWEHEMYSEMAMRLFVRDMAMSQAVLASIYTLTVAKHYVGGSLSVAVVYPRGIWLEDQDYVDSMESRLKGYDAAISQMFLACANTQISPASLETAVDAFKGHILGLHKQHLDEEVKRMQADGGGLIAVNTPLSRLPLGTIITVDATGKISNAEFDVSQDKILKTAQKAIEDGNLLKLADGKTFPSSGS